MAEKFPLLQLPRRLQADFEPPYPSYSRCYQKAAGGLLPGTEQLFGRWWAVDESRLVEIGLALGMTLKAQPAKKAKKVAA